MMPENASAKDILPRPVKIGAIVVISLLLFVWGSWWALYQRGIRVLEDKVADLSARGYVVELAQLAPPSEEMNLPALRKWKNWSHRADAHADFERFSDDLPDPLISDETFLKWLVGGEPLPPDVASVRAATTSLVDEAYELLLSHTFNRSMYALRELSAVDEPGVKKPYWDLDITMLMTERGLMHAGLWNIAFADDPEQALDAMDVQVATLAHQQSLIEAMILIAASQLRDQAYRLAYYRGLLTQDRLQRWLQEDVNLPLQWTQVGMAGERLGHIAIAREFFNDQDYIVAGISGQSVIAGYALLPFLGPDVAQNIECLAQLEDYWRSPIAATPYPAMPKGQWSFAKAMVPNLQEAYITAWEAAAQRRAQRATIIMQEDLRQGIVLPGDQHEAMQRYGEWLHPSPHAAKLLYTRLDAESMSWHIDESVWVPPQAKGRYGPSGRTIADGRSFKRAYADLFTEKK